MVRVFALAEDGTTARVARDQVVYYHLQSCTARSVSTKRCVVRAQGPLVPRHPHTVSPGNGVRDSGVLTQSSHPHTECQYQACGTRMGHRGSDRDPVTLDEEPHGLPPAPPPSASLT
eukprot:2939077-Rhodomonas_salina.1